MAHVFYHTFSTYRKWKPHGETLPHKSRVLWKCSIGKDLKNKWMVPRNLISLIYLHKPTQYVVFIKYHRYIKTALGHQ